MDYSPNYTTMMLITAIITAITSSGFTSIVLYLIQRRDKKRELEALNNSAESRMILGLGHDKIVYLTDKFVRRGAISLIEKRNLEYLYLPYTRLGGNGDCKIGYDACQDLPVVSEEEARAMDIAEKRRDFGYENDERDV